MSLRNYLNKIKPQFEEGGKLHSFKSLYDGFDTFLYVPNTTSKSGVNIHDAIDSKRIMSIVVIALIPALLFGMYNVGYQNYLAAGTLAEASFFSVFAYGFLAVLPKILVSYIVGLGIEFAWAQWKGDTGRFLGIRYPYSADCSGWLSAVGTCCCNSLCGYIRKGNIRRNWYEHLQCGTRYARVPFLLLSSEDEWRQRLDCNRQDFRTW